MEHHFSSNIAYKGQKPGEDQSFSMHTPKPQPPPPTPHLHKTDYTRTPLDGLKHIEASAITVVDDAIEGTVKIFFGILNSVVKAFLVSIGHSDAYNSFRFYIGQPVTYIGLGVATGVFIKTVRG